MPQVNNPYRQIKRTASAAPAPAAAKPAPKQTFDKKADEETHDAAGNFNPQAFGGMRDDVAAAIGNKKAKMFDDAGEINATTSVMLSSKSRISSTT